MNCDENFIMAAQTILGRFGPKCILYLVRFLPVRAKGPIQFFRRKIGIRKDLEAKGLGVVGPLFRGDGRGYPIPPPGVFLWFP